MSNLQTSKELLKSVHTIVSSTKGKLLNDELVEELKSETSVMMSFYEISHFQSIVLSIYLECGLKDIDVDTERLVDYFGKNISCLADINQAIDELSQKKLLFTKRHDYTSRRKSAYNKLIQVHHKALDAMMKGNKELLGEQQLDNFFGLLGEVRDLICKRIESTITTEMLGEEVRGLLESNKQFMEVEWLLSQENLTNYDLVLVLDLAIEHLEGADEVDFDKLIKEVFSEIHDRVKYKRNVKENNCILFKNDIVVFSDEMLSFLNYVKLSDDAMDVLLGGYKDSIKKDFKPKMGILINPEKIESEQLFYNDAENEQIATLSNALEDTNYKNLMTRLQQNGMKQGFTVLLYGYPGTGKTSSVKQVAKATGRSIFMVEIQKIQSKWVGESEKNLSKVFEEYKQARRHFAKAPILLFNEADAILGKRMSVNSSVDKSFNTLQNILLQELEEFEGIFMATTNLADQLDSAFDRRLLYKIDFKKPAEPVRKKILSNVFKNISTKTIDALTNQFSLTGGQIANIKKKLLVKSVLDVNLDQESYLMTLCNEEFILSKSGRSKIGFIHS
jgi:ATP-dependent 26S proteasome regulatory subunit